LATLERDLSIFKPGNWKRAPFAISVTKKISYMVFFEVTDALYLDVIGKSNINQIIKDWHSGKQLNFLQSLSEE
jgi:hypothetical protein